MGVAHDNDDAWFSMHLIAREKAGEFLSFRRVNITIGYENPYVRASELP